MTDTQSLTQRIQAIENRNAIVEQSKAWEISITRRVCVAIITYIVLVVFFYNVSSPDPFINAIVPTIGFLLSTLSLSVAKRIWINRQQKNPM